MPTGSPRLAVALIAGTIAILLNSAALALADLVPVATAHGGLLRFLGMLSGGAIHLPSGPVFGFAFHFLVGLAMAVFYAYALEPRLPGPPWWRGFLYALAVWIVNAAVVLPALGEGFAGSRYLSFAGLVWFAAAHTLFFVIMAVLYARMMSSPRGIAASG